MITKADVIKLWRKDVPVDAIKTLNKLFADLHEALAWKEAYREVAINCEDRYWEDAPHAQCVKNVDAEAKRIVDKE